MQHPVLSIIIPAYNRPSLLRHTIDSAVAASEKVDAEIIVVDDGSSPPLSTQITHMPPLVRFIRQHNYGSIIARQSGLKESCGTYVQFLDSDDLLHRDKFKHQLSAMIEYDLDISYCDTAIADLNQQDTAKDYRPYQILAEVADATELLLRVQPMPHVPIYRRSYLERYLKKPLIEPKRIFDPVGDIWIYFNLAPFPAKVKKVSGALAISGNHTDERYSQSWEVLGAASISLMYAFMHCCPKTESSLAARQRTGECAFVSWRKLPQQFSQPLEEALLEIWRLAPSCDLTNLGGRYFQLLAKHLGPLTAARILRRLQRPHYSRINTIDDKKLAELERGFLEMSTELRSSCA